MDNKRIVDEIGDIIYELEDIKSILNGSDMGYQKEITFLNLVFNRLFENKVPHMLIMELIGFYKQLEYLELEDDVGFYRFKSKDEYEFNRICEKINEYLNLD